MAHNCRTFRLLCVFLCVSVFLAFLPPFLIVIDSLVIYFCVTVFLFPFSLTVFLHFFITQIPCFLSILTFRSLLFSALTVSLLNVLHLEATFCPSAHCRFLVTKTRRTMFWFVPFSAVGLLENVQKTNNLNVRVFESLVTYFQRKRLRWSRGSVLAFGTQVRGFKPGRSRRIFQGEKKSSARLPSDGK